MKPKADWSTLFIFFAVKSKKAKKNVGSFFGTIYGAPICLWFYLTFSQKRQGIKTLKYII
jgi:hypothetical protein